ncbi:hypothetical protein BZZ01_25840 [Nostocales cyanobacterium HT-58-2]|nr:hypothetical protein BZZ01_25840 [Nostocales cyanobacterium HT-58-2]
MQLNGEKLQQLQNALLSAFPNQGELKQFIRFQLDKNLNEIAVSNGATYSDVMFDLITWAESEDKLTKLISAVCSQKPNNPQLKPFCEQLQQQQAPTKQSYKLMNPCNFDLHQLIEDCVEKLDGKQGLVGLCVPCGDAIFQKNFCQRLKDELGTSNIQVKTSLALDPRITSVERVVTQINRYQKLLQTSEIICPIQVQIFDKNLNIPHDFWQKISTEFKNNFQNRLIIIMWGSEGCIFPKDVIPLNPPQFKKVHAHLWIREVTNNLGQGWTQQEVMQEWKRIMITACCHDISQSDSQSELLDIIRVYEHIEESRELLQQNLSAKDFLQELEQRI